MIMEYIEIPCYSGEGFKIRVNELLYKNKSEYQEIAIYDTEPFGRCLLLDGDLQTSEADHELYDKTVLKKLRPDDRRILILGGGDGYTAETALKINPHLEVTLVDIDRAVIDACRAHLNQKVFEDPRVSLVINDAFVFLKSTNGSTYDGIVCDFTDMPVGYDDGKIQLFFSTVFSISKRILKDSGWIGIYSGSNDAKIIPVLKEAFPNIESLEITIPSFGESSSFLYAGKNGHQDSYGKRNINVEVITEATEDLVKQIMELGESTYPISSNGDDVATYFDDFNNPEYINIILRREDRIIGYLLATPQKDACILLKTIDPEMLDDKNIYYVDTMITMPGERLSNGFVLLLSAMFEEAKNRGINKFSLHARKSNGLSRTVLRLFPSAKCYRTIKFRDYSDELFDYIEGEYIKQ